MRGRGRRERRTDFINERAFRPERAGLVHKVFELRRRQTVTRRRAEYDGISPFQIVVRRFFDVVGFLFAFHDVSAALQRSKGRLFPFGLIDILLELKRTNTVSVNGMGILPEFQGHGGNAMLYSEMGHTLLDFKQFAHVEMTQVAETTEQMRADLKNLNGVEYKNHRVYMKSLL